MTQRQIVLTGFTGCGKTTLFNLICKAKQPAAAGGNSLTRQTFLKEAAYGKGFRVLDTPGYGSKQEKIIHAVGVLNALSEGPLRQILLVVKWERLDIIQDYLKSMVVKFRRYKHLLTVAVTHWDMAQKETIKQNQDQIIKLSQHFGINSVIFVSKFDSGEKVCAQIDSILDRSQAENVQLTETEFYTNFELIELKDNIELELEFSKEDVELIFKKKATCIREFIKKFDEKNPSMHEIMHSLTLETKRIAENLITDFERKNNDKFSKLFEYHSNPSLAYLVHFELKKALMLEIDSIIQLAQQKMKSDKNHCFNFIKACPHCGIIWLKVSGCDGKTTCGNFPDADDEIFNNYKTPQKYIFNITEKELNYSLNQVTYKPVQIGNYVKPQSGKGCGEIINWKEIPALTSNQLKELIDPGVMDYFAREIPKENIDKTLMKAQQSVKDKVETIKKSTKVIRLPKY
ncbi:unnamed protein product [Paramecium octaurelia]|uniref:G domain-containing protein n=1 Tax=Paramecium octaurelia TaxID=43137 RepID=A0A8S1WVA2_PAROT|nr:unnamed protein product [Paramecium octaurelia]